MIPQSPSGLYPDFPIVCSARDTSVSYLAEKVNDLAKQDKRDKTFWEADQHNLAVLTEDFNQFVGETRENKDLVNGSLQRIQKDLGQNTETVKQHAEILLLIRATVDEQTRRLDDHDTKLHDSKVLLSLEARTV
ncbi:hypothetical protein ACLB2K_006906 [Fragaria x ananassa]